jgi:hypothetical protein
LEGGPIVQMPNLVKKILEKIMGFKHTTQDQDFYLALGPEFYSYGYCTQ